MDRDSKHKKMSVVVHALAAIAVGYLSPQMEALYAGALGIAILIGIGFTLERVAGKRGFKWWAANGIFIYLLLWLVMWTYFLNT